MRYPGGKGTRFHHLVNMIPPHETFIESHAGGAAVLRHKSLAKKSIALDIDPSVVATLRQLNLPELEIICCDAISYLANRFWTGGEFVFCDPPYLPATRKRKRVYRFDYSEADHIRLLEVLRVLSVPVMICGYESDLYAEYLCGWRRRKFAGDSHTGHRVEMVWLNYEPDILHDYRYLGENCTERQRIRRKRSRLLSKINSLPKLEYLALMQEIKKSQRVLNADGG